MLKKKWILLYSSPGLYDRCYHQYLKTLDFSGFLFLPCSFLFKALIINMEGVFWKWCHHSGRSLKMVMVVVFFLTVYNYLYGLCKCELLYKLVCTFVLLDVPLCLWDYGYSEVAIIVLSPTSGVLVWCSRLCMGVCECVCVCMHSHTVSVIALATACGVLLLLLVVLTIACLRHRHSTSRYQLLH